MKGPALLLSTALVCCATDPCAPEPAMPQGPDPIGRIDTSASPSGVVALPDTVDPRLHAWFDRYTALIAPGGEPIHVLAQSGWREEQIVRARKVLEHILSDVPGTRLGRDKSAVADALAARRATLVLFDDVEALERAWEAGLGELELSMQDLRADECPVEGDPDYLAHATRDAAFEEVLHLVHDYGIRPVQPDFDQALHLANLAAAKQGIWQGWPEDEPENWRNEYFAAMYDNYLDLWALEPTLYEGEALSDEDIPDGSSHFGRYGANTRATLRAVDPTGCALIEDFFGPHLTYCPELPADFEGTFYLRLEPGLRYTHKSRHLVSVTLTGGLDSGLVGNAWDNRLTGNAGDNVLEGGPGDDLLFGGHGQDEAVFSGEPEEYEISEEGAFRRVRDLRAGRDGSDLVSGVEALRFRASGRRIQYLGY